MLTMRICAALGIAMAVSGPAHAAILTATASNIESIFKTANAGDTIQAVGSFGALGFLNRSFSSALTIDGTQATFTDTVTISGVSNVKFVGGTFGSTTATLRTGRAVGIFNSSGITFSKNFFIGNGAGMGLTMAGSSGVTVSAGNFNSFKLGLGVTSSENVRISSSRFIRMFSDGINIADSHFVTATANRCFSGTPTITAHPDCIQLWSILGNPVQSDISLTNNIVDGPTQGLTSFNGSDGGGLRISMIGNTISTSFPQGIACYNCVDSIFRDNVLTTLPGAQWRTSMNIIGGSNNIIENNSIGAKPTGSELETLTGSLASAYDRSAYYNEPLPDFVLEDMAYLATLRGIGLRPSFEGESDALTAFSVGEAVTAVPEPAMWAQMLLGFGIAGAAMRRRSARLRAG